MDAAGQGLVGPVPPDLAQLLRRAALDHVTVERRRVHPPVLHVGVPGAGERVLAVRRDEPSDHGLRTDVVAALLSAARSAGPSRPSRPPLVWLTRTGPLELQDVDAEWSSAARAAYAEAEVPLVLVVVTRQGWWDPRSGASRTWRRLRPR